MTADQQDFAGLPDADAGAAQAEPGAAGAAAWIHPSHSMALGKL